jgi:hypothetical protein
MTIEVFDKSAEDNSATTVLGERNAATSTSQTRTTTGLLDAAAIFLASEAAALPVNRRICFFI